MPSRLPTRLGPALAAILVISGLGAAAGSAAPQEAPAGFDLVRKVQIGPAGWTDSGLNVKKGEEYFFQADGSISLQKDNPVAACGPEGLALRTMQQPLLDQNLGALICRVREKVEVVEDKKSGEKVARDVGEMFFVGKENRIAFPADGRLLFGVNENVLDDNDGVFEVRIYLKRAAARPGPER